MASNSISSELKELEQVLRDLDPTALDADFLSRLEVAAEGGLTELSTAELQFEKSLRGRIPRALSPDFLARLESSVAGVEFAVDEKIVLFPKHAAKAVTPVQKSRYSTWAAAAVALIGGATALMMPGLKTSSPSMANRVTVNRSAAAVNASNYVPAGFKSGLGDAIDQGVTWHQADKPHRVVKVTYLDKITLKNAEGKTVEVEQPRTEYIFVPEKMD